MNIEIQSGKLILTLVDTETGEIMTKEATLGDFKEKKSSTRKKKIEDDEPTPMIHVLDNKIQFNTKAIELTGFQPDDKVEISFEKKNRILSPVLMLDDKGNRLTKTHTISYRGQKRDNLLTYGDTFTVELHPEREGIFKLIGNVEQPEDDVIDIPEEINADIDDIDFSFVEE